MNIREHETVETTSPVRRNKQPVLLRFAGVLACLAVAAAVAITLSPSLRQRLLGRSTRPVTVAIRATPPGADVFIDEQPVGATPTQAVLAPGEHHVRIVRSGYKPWRKVFDPADTATLEPALEPLKLGTLVVESQPDRANVFLDDDYRGTTPLRIQKVEAGTHTLRIAKEPLYQPVTRSVRVEAGKAERVVVQLTSGLETLYESRIQEHPKALSNYTELLHLHVINGRAAKAVEAITHALAILEGADASPADLRRFYGELAAVYRGQAGTIDEPTRKRLLDAIILLFEKLAIANPAEPEYYRPLVSLLGQAGQWQAILRVCDKAAKAPEAAGVVHVQVARMYLNWGEAKFAIMVLERAVKLRPTYCSARYYLGSAYHRANRPDDALREYLLAEKLAAKSSFYYQGLIQTGIARLLAAKGDVQGAIARFDKAVKLNVSPYYSCQWRLLYAEFLLQHGKKSEAIEQYRHIQRLTPSSKLGRAARKALRTLKGN